MLVFIFSLVLNVGVGFEVGAGLVFFVLYVIFVFFSFFRLVVGV